MNLSPPYEEAISLLCTIPGVDRFSAITLISEISTDMSQFRSPNHLCYWADLKPGNNEFADKEKSVRITRARVYLKSALIQCAHVTVLSTISSYLQEKILAYCKTKREKESNNYHRKDDAYRNLPYAFQWELK